MYYTAGSTLQKRTRKKENMRENAMGIVMQTKFIRHRKSFIVKEYTLVSNYYILEQILQGT